MAYNMSSVTILFAVFGSLVLFVDCATFKGISHYESLTRNSDIDEIKLKLDQLEKPDFDIFTEFFLNWKKRTNNDDQVLKCLVDHSPQISQVITDGEDSSRKCVKNGSEKVLKLGETIYNAQEEIKRLLNEFKVLITTCAAENKNSTNALKCIREKGIKIHNSLETEVLTIENTILKGHELIEITKACLLNAASSTADKVVAILLSISDCIRIKN